MTTDDGAGAGALPRRAARRADDGTACRCSAACSRSSATATSPASARRCTRTARRCRRIARTTSRRWRMRRSRTRKRMLRRRMMACTTSIGPGATNLVTAAALAHVNRLPVLLLPGDVFVSRAPDPVLQQVEDFHDGDVSANDCFRPVSRYFDRIVHPAQLLTALPRAMQRADRSRAVRSGDARAAAGRADDGLRLSGGVLRAARCRASRAPPPDARELAAAPRRVLRGARRPLIVAGGGVLYSAARPKRCARSPRRMACRSPRRRRARARCRGIIRCSWARSASPGRPRPTRSRATPTSCSRSARGCRTSRPARIRCSRRRDARRAQRQSRSTRCKWRGVALRRRRGARARRAVASARRLARRRARGRERAQRRGRRLARATSRASPAARDVRAALRRRRDRRRAALGGAIRPTHDIVVCAAGTLPGELHKLWRTSVPGGYHMEYGYSCMGYEIAGGLGVKMARPDREVVVMVGDGSYLMLNSEIATSVMLGQQAHRRRARQPRLRLHQPAAAGVRRRAVQQPARRLRAGPDGAPRDRLRRACADRWARWPRT